MYAFPSKGNGQMIKTDGMWKKGKIRVAKCHGYDGYIRVKNWQVWVKNLGGQKISKIKPFFGRFVQQV